MQKRFGHDFSNVRVHTDEKAAHSARAVNAREDESMARDIDASGSTNLRSILETGNKSEATAGLSAAP